MKETVCKKTKVKDLISILNTIDPETPVLFHRGDRYVNGFELVELLSRTAKNREGRDVILLVGHGEPLEDE